MDNSGRRAVEVSNWWGSNGSMVHGHRARSKSCRTAQGNRKSWPLDLRSGCLMSSIKKQLPDSQRESRLRLPPLDQHHLVSFPLSSSLILESFPLSRVAVLPPQSCRYSVFPHHATARAALSHLFGSWHEPYFSGLLVVAPSPVLVPHIQESWHARAHVGMSRHWSSLLFAPEESVPQKSPTATFVLLVNPRS
jgi:hypothetical protein